MPRERIKPRVVVEWPEGILGKPVFYPQGETDEEVAAIERFLEPLLDLDLKEKNA